MKPLATDPRVNRTRHLLRQSLMALLAEQDFASLTIQDVTDRAGIHRTTFYLHYTGLPALLEDCTQTLFNAMRTDIYTTANAKHTSSQLEPVVASVFYHLAEHSSFYRAMLGKRGNPLFQALFQKMLVELVFEPFANGETVKQMPLPLEMLIEFFVAGFGGMASWWLEI